MSAPAFTPGPWFVKDSPALMVVAQDDYPVIAELCAIDGSEGDAEFGNARLIAAAPELYEALEPFAKLGAMLTGPFAPALFKDSDAVGIGGAWSDSGERRTITFGDLRRAFAALTKARGEQQ